MCKYKRLAQNTVLVLIGNVGSKLIGLLMLPFYTSWLSVEDYGVTDMISVYVAFLANIISCCIAESVFIFPKGQSEKLKKEYFSSGMAFLLFSLMFSFLVFGLIDALSSSSSVSNSFINNIWLIYGLIAATLLQQMFQQFTRSIDNMVVYGMAGIVLALFTTILSFVFIPAMGVRGFVLSLILANIITGLYSFIFSHSYVYCSVKSVSKIRCREMLKYSVPLIPNGIMWWLVSALNRPIMESNVGLHAIGIFAVSNKFPSIISMLFGIFVTSWQISVLEEYGKKEFVDFYNKVFRGVVLLLFIMLVIITFSSKWLVATFASANFSEAWIYIPLLTLGTVFSNVSGLAGIIFSAVKQSKYFFYSSVYGGVTAIALNFILIPWLGLWGAVVSVGLSFMIMALSRIVYSWKYVKLDCLFQLLLMLVVSLLYIMFCLTTKCNSFVVGIMTIAMLLISNVDLIKLFIVGIIKNSNVK